MNKRYKQMGIMVGLLLLLAGMFWVAGARADYNADYDYTFVELNRIQREVTFLSDSMESHTTRREVCSLMKQILAAHKEGRNTGEWLKDKYLSKEIPEIDKYIQLTKKGIKLTRETIPTFGC